MGTRRLGAALGIICSALVGAQNAPDPTPMTRERTTFPMPEPANSTLPTLFIIGDSTVRNERGVGASGLWGWGEPVAEYFDSSKINVVNRAISGLSSRTYLTQGHWDRVLGLMKAGDFVIMQFGHNDASPINDNTRARGTVKGVGEEALEIDNLMTGEREVVHTYGWYMRRFIRDTRARGATPILCSPVPRNMWTEGRIVRSGDYGKWAAGIAQTEKIAFVDLNEMIASRYDALGQNAVAKLFPVDNTHTSRAGAELNAECVGAGLKALPDDPLAAYFTRTK